jgi:hypothetical protein
MLAKASKPLWGSSHNRDTYLKNNERNKDSGDTMTQKFEITAHIAAENSKTENQIKNALLKGLENQETPELREAAAAIEVNEK